MGERHIIGDGERPSFQLSVGRILIALVVLTFFGVDPASSEQQSGTCGFVERASPLVDATLTRVAQPPVKFSIPLAYLASPVLVERNNRAPSSGILLVATAVSLQPKPRSTENGFDTRSPEPPLSILIEDRYALPKVAQSTLDIYAAVATGLNTPRNPYEYGLDIFDTSASESNKDFYLSQNGASDFLVCDRGGAIRGVRNPLCADYTSVADLQIQLIYSKAQLRDWKSIKDKSSQFIKCLVKE